MSFFNTGGSLFGGANTNTNANANQPSQPSLFGNTNTNTNPAPGTTPSLFGNTNAGNTTTTPATGGGLFGGAATNTGGGLFGNTNTNTNTATQPSTGGGLFGTNTANTGTQPATGGGLFGGGAANTGTQPATGGGLFGGAAANTGAGGGGLFGNNAGGTAAPGAPAGGGGGLFGNTGATNTNTGTTGGLFGTSNTGGGGLFGNTNANQAGATGTTGGGLFGNTGAAGTTGTTGGLFGNTGAAGTTGTTTGGLFGNAGANAAGTTTTGTGGLFGNTANTNPGTTGSLFGNTGAQNTTTTGGLFGNTATNTQQNPAAGSSLFGGANNQAGTSSLFGGPKPAGSLFGTTNTNTGAATNTGTLFGGQQQQQQQQQQQGGLFGSTLGTSTNTGGLFGTANKPGLGVTTTTNTSGQPGFGGSTLGASGLRTPGGPANPHTQQDLVTQYFKLTQTIQAVMDAWNPASKDCRFQYNFYNLVDPKQVALYGRPPNVLNDAVWEKAVRENPDPSCFVPVIAFGFDDVRTRVDAQAKQAAEHLKKIADVKSRLSVLATHHSVNNASRLLRAATAQTQLTQRLMAMIQHLHLLIPAVRSSSLRPEEEALRGKLEEIEEEMKRGRVKGKLNELWALLGALNASMSGEYRARAQSGGGGEWAVVDEDGLAQIAQILAEQQTGLLHLTKILQKAQKDMAVIMGKGPSDVGTPAEIENLWSSTNTLRGSTFR